MFHGNLWVVVPLYNEAGGIRPTIRALAGQHDRDFRLVLVDNGSTDGSAGVVRQALAELDLEAVIIDEPQKGTGAAADSGFRYAITHGASHVARTDADCLPAADWVIEIKRAFTDGLEFVGGKIRPRRDEIRLTRLDRLVIPLLVLICEYYGKLFWNGRQYKYRFFMAAGNNLAISAAMYQRAGGFQQVAIDEFDEDRLLAETVRTLTDRAAFRRRMVVYNSIRRVRRYGYLNVLRWYWNRHPAGEVDIR